MATTEDDEQLDLGVADYLANRDQPVGPRLKDSLMYGVQQQPDTQARVRKYARDLNVPLPAALGDKDHVLAQGRAHELDANAMVTGTPRTASWMAEPDNAAVAHDDTKEMGNIERWLRLAQQGVTSAPLSFDQGVMGVVQMLRDSYLNAGRTAASTFGDTKGVAAIDRLLARDITGKSRQDIEAVKGDLMVAQPQNAIESGIYSGFQSLAQNAPIVAAAIATRNPEIAAGAMGALTGGQAYGEGRQAGQTANQAMRHGLIQGTIETGTEMIPMGDLVKDVLGKTGLGKTIAKQFIEENVGEQIATFTQDLDDWLELHPEKKAADFWAERGDAALATFVATNIGVGGNVALAETANAINSHVQASQQREQQAQDSQRQNDFIEGLMKSATASALRARDPQTFKEFVDHVTEDTPVDRVYVNATDLVDALAQGSPEAVAQSAELMKAMPSVAAQIEDAYGSNGLVEIPISELLAYTPDTHLAQSLIEHLKVDPESMSMAEADAFLQSQGESLKAEVAKAVEGQANADVFQASAEKVHAGLKTQLDAANRFTPDVNDAYAGLVTSFYSTMAARMGTTPEALAEAHPLTIRAQGVSEGSLMASAKPNDLANAAFKEWFGDSQVKDEGGAPLVVYHGTNQPISSFSAERLGVNTKSNSSRHGFFFTSSPEIAGRYAEHAGKIQVADAVAHEAKVKELRAKVERLEKQAQRTGKWDDYEAAMAEWEDTELGAIRADEITGQNIVPTFLKMVNPKTIDMGGKALPPDFAEQIAQAKAEGHDGVILKDITDPPPGVSDHYVVFSPTQIKSVFNEGTFDPANPDMLKQSDAHFSYEPGLGFQSSLFNTVLNAGQGKASADQWLATLRNAPGVKKEEIEWIGLPEGLALMEAESGKISREQVLTFIAQNGVRLDETVQGTAKLNMSSQYALPEVVAVLAKAGEPVTELENDSKAYFALREKFPDLIDEEDWAYTVVDDLVVEPAMTDFSDFRLPGGTNYREVLLRMPQKGHPNDPGGMSNPQLKSFFTPDMGHWREENVIAHARLTDRTDADGKKVLFIEEVQSDWHQKGREEGYGAPATFEERALARAARDQARKDLEETAKTFAEVVRELAEERADQLYALENRTPYDDHMRDRIDRHAQVALTDSNDTQRARTWLRLLNDRDVWGDMAGRRSDAFELAEDLNKRALRLAELQQEYDRTQAEGIPDAPFKTTWPALVMKRLIREAIEGGYDKVAWIHGDQQNGGATEQVEGIKLFYDRNLGNITNDIIKKFGAKVEPVTVNFNFTKDDQGRSLRRSDWTDEEQAEIDRLIGVIQEAREKLAEVQVRFDAARAHGTSPEVRNQVSQEREQAHQAWKAAQAAAEAYDRRLRDAKHLGFEITDKMRAENDAVQPKLFQEPGTGPRGAFSPQTNTITILRNADLSTFLHETGHFFLETMARVAADEATPADVKADWAKAAKFIGFDGIDPGAWLAIPVDGRREAHETFARGFEAYLREGKAPSRGLTGLFQKFRSWLLQVYQNLTQLNVTLTDEVRGVFDRLLATEQDIAAAEATRGFAPIFETKPEGMTDIEWEAYQRLGADATADAEDELAARSIRDMQWLRNTRARIIADLRREAREKRAAMRAEVSAEVTAQPIYRAMQFLKRGLLDGEAAGIPHKLSIEEMQDIYGDNPGAPWQHLGYGKYGMLASAEGGNAIHPDQAAELFGFSSGDHLVRELLAAEPMSTLIEGMTDQRMLERYGDLVDDNAIAKAADEAIHNDARLRFVATEANALAKATGKVRVLAEAARDYARELIARQRIRDLKPAKYTGAETRAAVAAARAAAKGNLVEAATEKRNQLINGYAAKAAFEAQKEVEKALRFFARLQGEGARKNMDADYRDQIDQLLERFDLRKGETLRNIDKRKSLAKWIEAMQARGLEPLIDEDLANEAYRKHYRDMTVEEMRGLVDAVKNIAHLGRLKNRLLVAANQRAFSAVVEEAAALIRDNAYKTNKTKIESNTALDSIGHGFASFFTIHRKFASLIREMSGLKNEGGILWRAFIQPMNKANDREASMREQATVALADIYKPLVQKGGLRKKMFIPEIGTSLSLEGRLAVALNWGNELNRARIMDGDKWTADQASAIIRTLTAEQLGFVNKMWEYLDTFFPQVAAKERRVSGVEPQKVEAEPFQVQSADGQLVDMRGGYYPIKYDTRRSSRSKADAESEPVINTGRGLYARATTRRGHTKARVEKVERPVRKDLSVPFGHVSEVIHDLAFHEYLIDANRLISAAEIDQAIRDHYSPEVIDAIKATLKDIAEGELGAQNGLEAAMNYIRTGTTIVGLGWNLMTGLLQPLGLTQSIVRVGPKYMAKGIAAAFKDAATLQNTVEKIGAKSDFMRTRAKTFMREINEVQNQVKDSVKPAIMGPIEASFFVLIQKLQLIADVPTWLGAYDKALAGGEDETDAVAMADQAVRDSQGSGQTGDLAQIQRGNVWFKLWTNFYSFFNIGYNQMAESLAETRRVGPSRLPLLAADVALVAFLPAILGELMKAAIRGDDWDDEWKKLAKAQVSYLLGFMVGMRELGGIVSNDGKAVSGPASLRLLTSDLPKAYQQIEQGEWDDAARKAFLNVAGTLFHFPAGQINRTIDGIEALAKGETNRPTAILVGPPHKAH